MTDNRFEEPLHYLQEVLADPVQSVAEANMQIDLTWQELHHMGASAVCLSLPHVMDSQSRTHRVAPVDHETLLLPDSNPAVIGRLTVHSPFGVNGVRHQLLRVVLREVDVEGEIQRFLRCDVKTLGASLIVTTIINQVLVEGTKFPRYVELTAK